MHIAKDSEAYPSMSLCCTCLARAITLFLSLPLSLSLSLALAGTIHLSLYPSDLSCLSRGWECLAHLLGSGKGWWHEPVGQHRDSEVRAGMDGWAIYPNLIPSWTKKKHAWPISSQKKHGSYMSEMIWDYFSWLLLAYHSPTRERVPAHVSDTCMKFLTISKC